MKMRSIIAMVTLSALIVTCFAPMHMAKAEAVSDWQMFYYASNTTLYGALKAGELDIQFWEVTPAQYQDAINDPSIFLVPVGRTDFRCFSLNNNLTINVVANNYANPLSHYHPTDMTKASYFKKAIHCLTNKEYYVNTILNGFGYVCDSVVNQPAWGWNNQSVINYVRANLYYSRTKAQQWLTDAGFTDSDADGTLNYPAGWMGRSGRPNMDPIIFYIRSDDIIRRQAGLHLAGEMEAVGIPVDERLATFATCNTYVMTNRQYHIYTAGWSTGRFPTWLYGWFHSSRWFPGGSNYHISTTPTIPGLDAAADAVQYPASYQAALTAAQYAQYLVTEVYTAFIPLWSSRAFFPYKDTVVGVTNQQGLGPEGYGTYLKSKRIDGSSTVRVGVLNAPSQVNPIYSRWWWDAETMGNYMDGFFRTAPYNLLTDQPLLAQDWSSPPGTWLRNGIPCSTMTFWFRDDESDGGTGLGDGSGGVLGDKDGEWIEPITGDVLDDWTPQWLEGGGYEFNCWYYASEPAGWIYAGYRDIDHIRIFPDENKAIVYFTLQSYWSLYWPFGREIYAPRWKEAPLSTLETRNYAGPIGASTNLALPYRVMGAPVEVQSITRSDAVPMAKASGNDNNDYEIVEGRIRLYTAIPAGVSITVNYWARGDCSGYAPGGLFYPAPNNNIGRTWVGAGTHYVTEHVLGLGGWFACKKNPHYYLETVPYGELDFWWNYVPGPQPRAGYMQVDTLDVTIATFALDGQGYAVPSLNWQSGADLTWPGGAEPKGKVTVHDNTVVATDFGKILGATP